MSGNIPRSHTVMIFWDGWWVCLPSWGELHVTLANTEITQVSQVYTLPETNSQSTWKSAIPKGKFIIFQSSIFRGELAGFVSGRVLEMGVSKNRGGTPKSSILTGRVFHYFHHPFWGFTHPYFWKHRNCFIWNHYMGWFGIGWMSLRMRPPNSLGIFCLVDFLVIITCLQEKLNT